MYVKLSFPHKGFRCPRFCVGSRLNLYGSINTRRSLNNSFLLKEDGYKDDNGVNRSNNKANEVHNLFNNFNKKGANRKHHDSHLGHRINKEHYGKHIHQFDDKRLKKGHTDFRMSSGTVQAQNAVRHLIRKVHGCSPHYKVKFVDPQTGKLDQRNLASIVNNMDFHEQGLYVVPAANNSDLPLVKINKTHEMIKMYSDELAAQREKELLSRGSIAAQKALRQRDKAEKKKSAAKVLNVSWNIGLGDLAKQKKDEIQRRLAKGDRLTIEVGNRRQAVRFNFDEEHAQDDEENTQSKNVNDDTCSDYDFEMRRREMIIEEICKISEESNCAFETYGSIKSKIAVICTPRFNAQSTKRDDSTETSERELRKQEKSKLNQKQKEKNSKPNKQESDLDAMYNFKIED